MTRNNMMKKFVALGLAMSMTLALGACASDDNKATTAATNAATTEAPATTVAATEAAPTTEATAEATSEATTAEDPKQYDGKLVFDHSMELTYAKNFSVDYYKGGYKLIKINKNDNQLLIVPEGMSVPADLDANVVVMQQPINNLLISSTPTTSLFNSIGALDRISLTTYDVDSWYIDEVKQALTDGKMTYIGNYKTPDYEKIVASGSKFAVFSTMITEDVAAELDKLDVKYVTDQASDEEHPLARVEWAKLYGAMFNLEEVAEKHFAAQEKLVLDIASKEATDKSVAIFYITSKGDLYARNTDDYMAKMIKLAGGQYVLDGKVGVGKTGTVKMEAEAFFDGAKDADVIIYIWSMGGKPDTLAALIEKSPVLADMKAIKEGNVWCTTPDYFQISSTIGNMINDMNLMLNADGSQEKFTYLYKLK